MSSTKPNSFFFLIDCNSFFVSCEKVFKPHLAEKPVVVLSNNDGCVISRSKEAKEVGIPMGAPAFKYQQLFKEKGVFVFSSNFSLYGDMSHRVMSVLSQFSPDMEEYSVDEAFLLIDSDQPKETAAEIRTQVHKWTGIPVSIGIGKTKTLAKVANDLAKKGNGIVFLETESEINTTLNTLPPSAIWGIGRRLEEKLHEYGIHTALSFKNAHDGWLQKIFSVTVYKTALELRGMHCLSLETIPTAKQSITHSRSFGADIFDLTTLNEALSSYTTSAAEKMREEESYASFLSVFLMTSRFIPHPYGNSIAVSFAQPTNYTPLLIHHAKEALKKIYKEKYGYKKVGVTLYGLVPYANCQRDLFGESPMQTEKQIKAMQILDSVNQTWGEHTLHFAAEGNRKNWKPRREATSQRYTTCWEELLIVK